MHSRIQAALGCILSFFIVSESWAVGASGLSVQLFGAKALGQGNAFAGQADDPTALYYNPAGITQLKGTQLLVGGASVLNMTDRKGAGVPGDEMKRQLSFLPNFYLTNASLFGNEKISYGVGLYTPFGVTTEWAPTSSVRYVATTSKFETVSVNPSVAYQIVPQLSLGVGADYVNLLNTVAQNQTNQAGANLDNSPDGTAKLSGHGNGWGYNVGALYKPVEKHALGVSYRSQVKVPIHGSVELSNLSASSQANYNFASDVYSTTAHSSVILPASVIAGYAFNPSEKWTLVADYEWTQWNTLQSQEIALEESDPSRLAFLTGHPTSNVISVPRRWHNVSAVGLGANYKQNEAWQWRGGYSFFEKTVPNDTYRPDVPDANSHTITAGCSRSWESLVLDFAFNANIYAKRSVNNTVGNAVGASIDGDYTTFIPVLAMNLTYKFGATK